ncbi:hypothetical protein GJ629_06390 [Halapricum sp. CBA1109]|nr:hypothetical protein [Halapricum sp. CBA1109]
MTDVAPPLARFVAPLSDDPVETRAAAEDAVRDAPDERLTARIETLIGDVATTDGRERVEALELLYAAAAENAVPLDVTPLPVLDLLETPGRAGMLAAVIVRELAYDRLDTGDPADVPDRRQRAEHFGLEKARSDVEPSVLDALSADDPHVRAGAARGVFKMAWSRRGLPSITTGDISGPELFEHLMGATDDEDPRVRAYATLAAALVVTHLDDGAVDSALSAVAPAIEDDPVVRDRVEWLLSTWSEDGSAAVVSDLIGAVAGTLGPEWVDRLSGGRRLLDSESVEATLAEFPASGSALEAAPTASLAALVTAAGDSLDAPDGLVERLLDGIEDAPVAVTEALVTVGGPDASHLETAVRRLTALSSEGTVAATEALVEFGTARPNVLATNWDTVVTGLDFEGERAIPSARVVGTMALTDPETVTDTASVAATVLYEALDVSGADRRRERMDMLVALAAADPTAAPPGVDPFVDDTADPDREILAVVAEADPSTAGTALASLLSTVDPTSREYWTLLGVLEECPTAATHVVEQLVTVLVRREGHGNRRDRAAAAVAGAAATDPTTVEPHVGTLVTLLADGRATVRESAAEALGAVGEHDPDALPPAVATLSDGDRGEDWPVAPLAASAPRLLEQAVHNAVAGPYHGSGVGDLLSTVAAYHPDIAADGTTRLVERADAVGPTSSRWDLLEQVAESNPELAALGLEQVVENVVSAVEESHRLARLPAAPLAVLADYYPRRTWALLEQHDPECDPSSLPDRASERRAEETLTAVVSAASPDAPIPESRRSLADEPAEHD